MGVRRTILISLVTAVVAGAIAYGATILLTDDDQVAVPTAPPLSTQAPVATVTAEPTSSPSATSTDDGTEPAPAPTSTSTPVPDDGGEPAPVIRSAKSVDCDDDQKKCSAVHGAAREGGDAAGKFERSAPSYSGAPTISMDSDLRTQTAPCDDDPSCPNETKAAEGEPFKSIHVQVVVENKTAQTFVFAKREIALDIYRDGKLWDTLVTTGEGFNMTPGGKMTATFDRPIATDGDYEWQAKTWYYAK